MCSVIVSSPLCLSIAKQYVRIQTYIHPFVPKTFSYQPRDDGTHLVLNHESEADEAMSWLHQPGRKRHTSPNLSLCKRAHKLVSPNLKLFFYKCLQSTPCLYGVETEGEGMASNLGRSGDQGPGPDYRLAPSVPHNKIMLSAPTGIWFQWRG